MKPTVRQAREKKSSTFQLVHPGGDILKQNDIKHGLLCGHFFVLFLLSLFSWLVYVLPDAAIFAQSASLERLRVSLEEIEAFDRLLVEVLDNTSSSSKTQAERVRADKQVLEYLKASQERTRTCLETYKDEDGSVPMSSVLICHHRSETLREIHTHIHRAGWRRQSLPAWLVRTCFQTFQNNSKGSKLTTGAFQKKTTWFEHAFSSVATWISPDEAAFRIAHALNISVSLPHTWKCFCVCCFSWR